MADDFDPDAFLAGSVPAPAVAGAAGGFDPDAFLAAPSAPASKTPVTDFLSPYLPSIEETSPVLPAAVSGAPAEAWRATKEQAQSAWRNLSESLSPRERAPDEGLFEGFGRNVAALPERAGKFYTGLFEGATLPAAPLLGAGESLVGRPLAHAEYEVMKRLAPEEAAKTTPEQLYENAWRQKAGLALSAGMPRRGPAPVAGMEAPSPVLPVAQAELPPPSPMVDRPNLKVGDRPIRMLPPDYVEPEVAPGRASLSAAATPGEGPLAGISKEAVDLVREDINAAGYTPHTLEQRLEEMSSHQTLGEINENTTSQMSGLWASPGASKVEIASMLRQRERERPERLQAIFDRALGPAENTYEMSEMLRIEKQRESDPFWQKFKETPVRPTPTLTVLAPRLKKAGAWDFAEKQLGIEGVPTENKFLVTPPSRPGEPVEHIALAPNITTGAPETGTMSYPSAAFYEVVRQGLDNKISQLIANQGHPEEIRRLVMLKKALTDAIDNHPDPRIAGLWKQGREKSGEYAKRIEAMKFGNRVMTGHVHENELPLVTESWVPDQMRFALVGIRRWLNDQIGGKTGTGLRTINQALTESGRAKIRFFAGDQQADVMFRELEAEREMMAKTREIIGNPETGASAAARLAARDRWSPPPGRLARMAELARHPVRGTIAGGIEYAQGRMDTRAAARYNRIREEASRVYTLQGPERDAVARYLVNGPEGGVGPMAPPAGPQGPTNPPALPAPGPEAGPIPQPATNEPLRLDVLQRGRPRMVNGEMRPGIPMRSKPLPIGN